MWQCTTKIELTPSESDLSRLSFNLKGQSINLAHGDQFTSHAKHYTSSKNYYVALKNLGWVCWWCHFDVIRFILSWISGKKPALHKPKITFTGHISQVSKHGFITCIHSICANMHPTWEDCIQHLVAAMWEFSSIPHPWPSICWLWSSKPQFPHRWFSIRNSKKCSNITTKHGKHLPLNFSMLSCDYKVILSGRCCRQQVRQQKKKNKVCAQRERRRPREGKRQYTKTLY